MSRSIVPRVKKGIRVAVEGCCHGELDAIYATMKELEIREKKAIDLLICCGDFQAVRNLDDLECMACPPKYRSMQSFYKYYSGQRVAPYPTLFIGGNHEASNYMHELAYGGWAARNIYYLGAAGVVNFAGLRIGGISGTYSEAHYRLGNFEAPPYTPSSMRSAYHIRERDVWRLSGIRGALDIMLSHDWPQGIAKYGNVQELLRRKAFLRSEIADNSLGSPPGAFLLHKLRPSYWFSAHLHTKFAALVPHPKHDGAVEKAPQGEAAEAAAAAESDEGGRSRDGASERTAQEAREASQSLSGLSIPVVRHPATKFLSLDKCLPRRSFLQVVDFVHADAKQLRFAYDPEWLAILAATHKMHSASRFPPLLSPRPPAPPREEVAAVEERMRSANGGSLTVARDGFMPTASAYDPRRSRNRGRMPEAALRNPQTETFLAKMQLPYNLALGGRQRAEDVPPVPAMLARNPEEIDLDDGPDSCMEGGSDAKRPRPEMQAVLPALAAVMAAVPTSDPAEIDLE